MGYKIQHIKEFLKNGTPQFDIILRRDKHKAFVYGIVSGSKESDFCFNKTLFPQKDSEGIIQIVKRISDDRTFHQGEVIEIDNIGSCFIIEFSKDLVHCSVIDIYDQFPYDMEINELIWSVHIIATEEELEKDMIGDDSEQTTTEM